MTFLNERRFVFSSSTYKECQVLHCIIFQFDKDAISWAEER